jgi:hypothetical protein
MNAPAQINLVLMATAVMKDQVDAHSSTFHLRPKKLSERHGSTATAESL